MATLINVIIPTYNASGTVRLLTEQLEKELGRYDFRILFVDDASMDDTRDIIQTLAQEYPNIDYFFARKNRGQQASLHTGLKMISEPCEYVITMDDDLQNPVSVIPSLLETMKSGYDLVYAVPVIGKEAVNPSPSFIRRLGSRFRDLLFDSFPNKPAGVRVSAFRILSYELAVKIAESKKKYFYLSAEAFQYDIRTANITYEYVPRHCGRSSYRFGKLLLVYFRLLMSYKLKLL
ncbi:glycosyltransferase family 2 protein [Sinanaerobacter chloroacetimidivorans]|jgi:glycosyltransferase involved in cell wall biosynthesis|uniref:Glycosyltransferase family 2 protein n=1 Tax=Sinanaerobacter chloroacetimidivorans TaxID=2818044 RepID=A0A8J7VYT5_9FIRM|nr:glycosyltransferase family 2 protein [Sinanaerobacter chloroacetimidivorans]MBR0597171.1 glycosyltransferase family 2 protein [Sinanaerobacter chloroacetimidivorans]